MLKITNPATCKVIAEVLEDNPTSIERKYQLAHAAKPAWAATPLGKRLACIRKFREQIVTRMDELAAILTSEVGKPLQQSRNELNGLLGRIDFFLDETKRT